MFVKGFFDHINRLMHGGGVYYHPNIDASGNKANLNKQLQSEILEEIAYREMPGAQMDVIGRIDKQEQDPLKKQASAKPFIIQNTKAQKGQTVTARVLEPVYNQDLETAANQGRTRTEKMRSDEDEPDFSSIKIPNYFFRVGWGMDDVDEIETWTGINIEQTLDMQRSRAYGIHRWLAIFHTMLYGHSPNIQRADFANYGASAHSNMKWGTAFGADYNSLEDSLTGDRPSIAIAEAMAYETKRMKLPPVIINGKTYKAAYWCDYALWTAWRVALWKEGWKDMKIGDQDHPLHGHNIGTWAGILFIDHGSDPVAPKKWADLSTETDSSGTNNRTILTFPDAEDIPQAIGGSSAFSVAFITGAGAVRINDGTPLRVERDKAGEYEIRKAGWVGQLMGMKRADRVLNSDGTTNHNASFLHVLRRYKHDSE